jgi:hypothetical protein
MIDLPSLVHLMISLMDRLDLIRLRMPGLIDGIGLER